MYYMIFRFLLKALKKPMQTIAFVRFFIFRPNTYILSTMHQSGTHWLQVLLANILSKNFNLENVSDIHAKNIIPYYPHSFLYDKDYSVPKILHSHHNRNLFFFNKPTILLVRDIRDSLVSQYEKYNKANKTQISIFKKKSIKLIKSRLLKNNYFDFRLILQKLYKFGCRNLLVEGGNDLSENILKDKLFNQFYLFKSQKNLSKLVDYKGFNCLKYLSHKYKNKSKIYTKQGKDLIKLYKK